MKPWIRTNFRYAGLTLLTLAMIFIAAPAFAQGCALCYTQAASSGKKMIEALRSGILILVLPPTLGSIGMLFILYRKRYQIRRTDDDRGFTQH